MADLLRSTIHGLRPPMLEYGLYSALEALVDELAGRTGKLRVSLDVPASDIRHDRKIEQHLFRIVQQACENALRHANASQLTISGSVGRGSVELAVDDDGDGFSLEGGHDLVKLLTERHFGLAGMSERAALVRATLDLRTAPKQGTSIVIGWAPKQD
ncbi:MAG: hypothetical protein DWG76_05840 [Chloroflexi bacterium]|nr:hypothetical protein [Chloroflexota bacterium]